MSVITDEFVKLQIKEVLTRNGLSVFGLPLNDSDKRKLHNQINGTTKLSGDTILYILSIFPDVSAEWLLRGEGDMIKREHAGTTINLAKAEGGNANAGGTQNIGASDGEVDALKKRVAELEQDKANMQKLIDKLS